MTTFRPIQNAFTAGELSPLFYAQQESDLYSFGLKRCRNMIPLTQGGVTSRPGTVFLGEFGEHLVPATTARCIPIEIDQDSWVVAVFHGGGVTLVSADDISTVVQVVENPEFEEGLDDWVIDIDEGIGSGSPRTINGDSVIRLTSRFILIPLGPSITRLRQTAQVAIAPSEDMTIEFKLSVTEPSQVTGEVWAVSVSTIDYGDGIVYANGGSMSPGEDEIFRGTLLGTSGYTGPLYIQFTLSGFSRDPDSTLNVHRCHIRAPGVPVAPPDVLDTPYSDSEIEAVQYVSSPYLQTTFFVHPAHPPQELILEAAVWIFREIDFEFAGGGSEPNWDAINGYPSAIGGYQGRCVFAGSPGEPQAVWTSAPGEWYDVEQDAAPTADEPVWWTLSDRGAIRWVHGHKGLIHGASNAEHQVTANTGLLQAGDIQATKQSAYGSKAIQAIDAGENVVYVGGDGRKLRAISLDRDVLGWKSANLTWPSEHITRSGVHRLANSRDPYQIIWAPLGNGTLAAMSYEPTYKLQGWHLHETVGEFIDVCNARVGEFDYTFFMIRRQVDGVPKLYLEAIQEVTNAETLRYMDSYVRQFLPVPSTTISGLEHLEGMAVSVIADGEPRPDNVVVGGEITLELEASDVTVGLPYVALIETLPAVSPSDVGGLGAAKSWAQIGVRMVNSDAPIVNGIRQNEGDDVTMVELGWDQYATIVVEQDLPVTLTVTGIYGRLTTEDIIG